MREIIKNSLLAIAILSTSAAYANNKKQIVELNGDHLAKISLNSRSVASVLECDIDMYDESQNPPIKMESRKISINLKRQAREVYDESTKSDKKVDVLTASKVFAFKGSDTQGVKVRVDSIVGSNKLIVHYGYSWRELSYNSELFSHGWLGNPFDNNRVIYSLNSEGKLNDVLADNDNFDGSKINSCKIRSGLTLNSDGIDL